MTKTNAVRLLEQSGIKIEVREYDYDENDLNGMHIPAQIGLEAEQVFKTLVLKGGSGSFYVFCLPVCEELDLKKAAKAASEKNIALIPVKELLPNTGYIRGGCSPVGMKRNFPTFMDETATLFDRISFSAGQRGQQIIAEPNSIIRFLHAVIGDYTA